MISSPPRVKRSTIPLPQRIMISPPRRRSSPSPSPPPVLSPKEKVEKTPRVISPPRGRRGSFSPLSEKVEETQRIVSPPRGRKGSLSLSPSPIQSRVRELSPPRVAREKNENLQYISGPISWYYFELDNRKFHFFGDSHFSKEGNCESKQIVCSSFSDNNPKSDCYDIVYLLDTIFLNAEVNHHLVDFFLEVPYLQDEQTIDIDIVRQDDYISSTVSHFIDCFQKDKKRCRFRNTRFHYADVRQSINQGLSTINMYLGSQMQKLLKLFGKYVSNTNISQIEDIKLKILRSVEWLNFLINKLFYKNNDKSLFRRYFASQFSSEYIQELDSIYESLISGIDEEKYQKEIKSLQTVFERLKKLSKPFPKRTSGTRLHVTKIQLEELKKDMEKNPSIYPNHLPKLIEDYIISKSNQEDITFIKKSWKKYYDPIVEILNSKSESYQLDKIFSLNNQLPGIYGTIIKLEALLMDAYTLTRMFRTYTSSQKPTPFADMTITYTGALHTKHYYEFFTEVLKIKPTASLKPYTESKRSSYDQKRCLKDEKFSEYFSGYI
jgi:hypothetical protein